MICLVNLNRTSINLLSCFKYSVDEGQQTRNPRSMLKFKTKLIKNIGTVFVQCLSNLLKTFKKKTIKKCEKIHKSSVMLLPHLSPWIYQKTSRPVIEKFLGFPTDIIFCVDCKLTVWFLNKKFTSSCSKIYKEILSKRLQNNSG